MQIQAKLFLFAILCSVLPLLATFVFSFSAAKESLTNTVKTNLISQSTEQFEHLQLDLVHAKHMLRTLSMLSNMQHVRSGDTLGYLGKDLNRFSRRSPYFAEVVAADLSGNAVAGTIQHFVDKDLSGTWEFEAPKLGIYFDGPVVQSYRLGIDVATHSVPLYSSIDSTAVVGALIGSIDWGYIQNELSSYGVFGGDQSLQRQVYLESVADGRILYGTPGLRIPTELFAGSGENSEIKRVELNGRDYKMVSINSESFDGFRDPQWRMHVLLDADIAYASVHELKNYFLSACGLTICLVLALGMLFARSIVKPVKALVVAAEHVSNGDYDYDLPKHTAQDEIGLLTHSFDSMRTAVRSNEQELVAKTEVAEQAARLKGEFLANMSHEVRTPINGVLGMTELLLNTSLDSTQSRYAETISRSGRSLLAVINDILDFSKIEAGKLELSRYGFDLRDLAEDVVEMVAESAHKKGVEVTLDMPPNSHVAFNGDSARLRQVLLNLLSNAVKFTQKGEVRLTIDCKGVSDTNTSIRFSVVDTGIGIDPEKQSKIFESFVQADGTTTREFGGTGLGLAISKKIIDLMGGEIGVSSVVGRGSKFWFDLDLEALPNSTELAWRTPNTLKGKRILIVDDNSFNREILEKQVEYWGALPFVASNSAEALHEFESVSGTENIFEVGILDMQMPLMNGLELATILHTQGIASETRLIVLSSTSDSLDLTTCHNVGIHSLVNKPIRQQDLYHCLTAALGEASVERVDESKVVCALNTNTLSGHVLLAEDNPVNQEMMLEMLRLMGVTAELACNGQEVLEALDSGSFDLILMDCQMPVLDGFEATGVIRERESSSESENHIPILALTANAMQGDKEKCLAAGMDEYLSKPVSSQVLKQTMRKWLDAGKAESVHEIVSESDSTTFDCSSSTPEMDKQIFSDILTMCEKAPAGFYEKLVKKFEDSSEREYALLEQAVANSDCIAVGSIAHKLKSASACLGATGFSRTIHSLELMGKEENLEQAADAMMRIKHERELLVKYLRFAEVRAA